MEPFEPDPIRRFRNRFANETSLWGRLLLAQHASDAGEPTARPLARELALKFLRNAEAQPKSFDYAPGSIDVPAEWLAKNFPADAIPALARLIKENSFGASMAARTVAQHLGHDALPLYSAASSQPTDWDCLIGLVRAATETPKPSAPLDAAACQIADRLFRNAEPDYLVAIVISGIRLGASRWLPQLEAIRRGDHLGGALLANEFLLSHAEGGDDAARVALDRFGFGLPASAFNRMAWPESLQAAVATLASDLAPCARLRTTTGPGGTPSPGSALGGAPLLPADAPWPQSRDGDNCYYVGRIAQDVFAAAGQPAFGTLQFWLSTGSLEDGGLMDCDDAAVITRPEPGAIARPDPDLCPWKPTAVRAESCLSLASAHRDNDRHSPLAKARAALEQLADGIPDDRFERVHQIGGHLNYDARHAAEYARKKDGTALLLLGNDPRMGLGFSDTGCLLFAVTNGEFAAARIDSVGAGVSYA